MTDITDPQSGEFIAIEDKMLLGALLLITSAAWVAPAAANPTNTSGISKYELGSFIANFKHFRLSNAIPEMCHTDERNVKRWRLRNLPTPDTGTRWTYTGGAYMLISDTDDKVTKAYDDKIFYHR